MRLTPTRTLAASAIVALVAGLIWNATLQAPTVRRLGASAQDASEDAGPTYDSGPRHMGWILCSSCEATLVRLRDRRDIHAGLAYMSDAGVLVSTPQYGMYQSPCPGCPAWATPTYVTDPVHATVHRAHVEQNGAILTLFREEVPDVDKPLVDALIAQDAILADAGLPPPTPDASAWPFALPDGGILDGGGV